MRCGSITVLLLLAVCQIALAERYALIIGISNYPKESGFSTTTGANDIPYTLAALVYYGFDAKNITILKDSAATYEAITYSLHDITKKVKPGDDVFLHFSGHGQRVINYSKNRYEKDDSSWVPYNAHKSYKKWVYSGQSHLIDDELNTILHTIKGKIGESGRISVVVDACYSEGSTRDLKPRRQIRGVSETFSVPADDFLVLKEKNSDTAPENWLTLSACSDFEFNQEYREKDCGLLTYILYVKLKDKASTVPASTLLTLITEKYDQILKQQFNALPQTPHLDGPDNLKAQPFVRHD